MGYKKKGSRDSLIASSILAGLLVLSAGLMSLAGNSYGVRLAAGEMDTLLVPRAAPVTVQSACVTQCCSLRGSVNSTRFALQARHQQGLPCCASTAGPLPLCAAQCLFSKVSIAACGLRSCLLLCSDHGHLGPVHGQWFHQEEKVVPSGSAGWGLFHLHNRLLWQPGKWKVSRHPNITQL